MRCELFNYVEALLRSPRQKSANFIILFFGMFIVAVSVCFGCFAMNIAALTVSFLSGIVFLTAVKVSYATDNLPNIVAQMPLSPRKSLLYRFLSVFIIFVMVLILIFVLYAALGLIAGLVIIIINAAGNNAEEGKEIIETFSGSSMGVYGGIFSAVYFVFFYSMGMVVGFIKNNKIRTIVTGCLCAVLLGGMTLMRNPFIEESYAEMAVPWLSTVLCCIAAAAALGTAIYMGFIRYRKTF